MTYLSHPHAIVESIVQYRCMCVNIGRMLVSVWLCILV